MKNIWEKGQGEVADWAVRFAVGDDPVWDTILLPYDIQGTRAHVKALLMMGVYTMPERDLIFDALDELEREVREGKIVVTTEDEDMHTVIERYVTKKTGEVGERIHTGRSRNDQVLVAIRLFLKERLRNVASGICSIVDRLIDLADETATVPLPGYTHMQPAMPSTVGLWAAGYAELLLEDLEGLKNAYDRIDLCPWGSAAGYGVPHIAMPRQMVAEELGFSKVQFHVTSVQLSRGKAEAAVVHALVQFAATVNRLASDMLLFTMQEFGFLEIPDRFCTGSSIMPQKKNGDLVEISRGLFHKLNANLQLLLGLPANLVSGYHRDLQLTKAAVMESVLIATDLAEAWKELIPELRVKIDRLSHALPSALFATAEVYRRVASGETFRSAYKEVAKSLDSIVVPPESDMFTGYVTRGTPGNLDLEMLRNAAKKIRTWSSAE